MAYTWPELIQASQRPFLALHHGADYIFFDHLESLTSFKVFLKVEFFLSLENSTSVAYVLNCHEQPQINRVSYFHFFAVFFAVKGSSFPELIYIKIVDSCASGALPLLL